MKVSASELSLEEKIALVVGVGMPKNIPGAAGETRSIRGIPSIELSDGPSGLRVEPDGLRIYPSTAFPAPIMLASTWDPEIVEEVGRAIGIEASYNGIDILLAPGLNIHRHPLCGRNFEYFSEDPLLNGLMASSYVMGVQSAGIIATPKHFVANDQEVNRYIIDTVVSERALREIYLKPFEIVIKKASPGAIMTSYNKLNGKYTSQNPWLLEKILREEWGFRGIIMTDWGAGDNPVEQINSGVDLIMPGGDTYYNKLLEGARKGELDLRALDQRVERIIELINKIIKIRAERRPTSIDLNKHAEIAYKAALEGAILLKNDLETLPLKEGMKIAIFGTGQFETLKSGMGSGHNHSRYTISIYEGLKRSGLIVDEEISNIYEKYVLEKKGKEYLEKLYKDEVYPERLSQNVVPEELISKSADRNDVGIIVITRISGEDWDRKLAGGDYYLAHDERTLIEKVSREFRRRGKRVVAILNIAGPIEIYSWRDLIDAILLIWLPGQEAGRVVADLLLGRVAPSGKLPITFPRDWSTTPVARAPECYPGIPPENPSRVVYCEDIYVGYRYYDTFGVEPAYEFGYGLSYTKFRYRDLDVRIMGDRIEIGFTIENVGKYSGREVAQIYIKGPGILLPRPEQELKGFKKTKLLKPGESEEIYVTIDLKDLAIYHPDKKVWIVEKGWYEVRVGASSRDIRLRERIYVDRELYYI
ncbi:MAG: glycoside hydrolase family 3 N-terminal domain-containing protein [Desulfurococcales archaeon]|jgi:beta-glucosidase|nr:glycoside hydrolase family 3 N-terminal domain-containing protein [Desulfurococcales archaeon]